MSDSKKISVTPGDKPPPSSPTALPAAVSPIASVLNTTSLESNGGQPARIANLSYSNIVANTGRGAQNAVANQQAHTQLAIAVLGNTAARVQNLGPLHARSAVDVLTNNTLGEAIADLRAALAGLGADSPSGGGGGGPSGELARLLAELNKLEGLTGKGTINSPYHSHGRTVYVRGPLQLIFKQPVVVANDTVKARGRS